MLLGKISFLCKITPVHISPVLPWTFWRTRGLRLCPGLQGRLTLTHRTCLGHAWQTSCATATSSKQRTVTQRCSDWRVDEHSSGLSSQADPEHASTLWRVHKSTGRSYQLLDTVSFTYGHTLIWKLLIIGRSLFGKNIAISCFVDTRRPSWLETCMMSFFTSRLCSLNNGLSLQWICHNLDTY